MMLWLLDDFDLTQIEVRAEIDGSPHLPPIAVIVNDERIAVEVAVRHVVIDVVGHDGVIVLETEFLKVRTHVLCNAAHMPSPPSLWVYDGLSLFVYFVNTKNITAAVFSMISTIYFFS